jgi:hypothetical protein
MCTIVILRGCEEDELCLEGPDSSKLILDDSSGMERAEFAVSSDAHL